MVILGSHYGIPRTRQTAPCQGDVTSVHAAFPRSQGGLVSLQEEASATRAPGAGRSARTSRSNVRWKLFVLLLVLVGVNYIDRGSISVALPIIQKEFGLAPELVGLLLSAFFWTYALMQVPVGWLIDRFGPRKVITASCIGWGAATAASGLAGGFLNMFIARMGIGVTEAGV